MGAWTSKVAYANVTALTAPSILLGGQPTSRATGKSISTWHVFLRQYCYNTLSRQCLDRHCAVYRHKMIQPPIVSRWRVVAWVECSVSSDADALDEVGHD